ncbi:MAG: 50S ribosomal protein L11 methyltransferase [Bdellovibrionales bacterium]|nr:50S ribosomal protein L11 methyltransferase [Bdellovibrionales bacterium]
MGENFWTLILDGVQDFEEDQISLFLFENGASGVQENLVFEQKDRKYLPQVVEQSVKQLMAYFEQLPAEGFIENLQSLYPNIQVHWQENPIKDWLSEWKAQWQPFALVTDFWVVPDWHKDSFDLKERKAIFIEPGMAFGTGTHETTQIASELIVQAVQQVSIRSALDVGTGSGILTLLMGLLGVQTLAAYDNDEFSENVFFENLQKNNVSAQWLPCWSKDFAGKTDLLVANIIDGVLIELKPEFQKVRSPYLIFTGILQEREAGFLEDMITHWDLKIIQRLQKGEWVGFFMEDPKHSQGKDS